MERTLRVISMKLLWNNRYQISIVDADGLVFQQPNTSWHLQEFLLYSCKCPIWTSFTHWGRVTHMWISELIINGSYNGLSPGRCQAIIWTSARILFIWPLGTNFSKMLIKFPISSFKKMPLKMMSAKYRPFCLSLNLVKPIHHNKRGNTYLHVDVEISFMGIHHDADIGYDDCYIMTI